MPKAASSKDSLGLAGNSSCQELSATLVHELSRTVLQQVQLSEECEPRDVENEGFKLGGRGGGGAEYVLRT